MLRKAGTSPYTRAEITACSLFLLTLSPGLSVLSLGCVRRQLGTLLSASAGQDLWGVTRRHSTEAHGPHLCTLVMDEAPVTTEAGAAPQNHRL